MKNLIFIAIAIGIFSGISIKAKAQASVNLERQNTKPKAKTSLKFIEGIEITPDKISSNLPVDETAETPVINNNIPASYNTIGTSIEHCSPLQFKYAMLMDREVETFTNTALYTVIDEWWGTRYRYGGADKTGIDCSAFSAKILSSVYGINAPRTASDQYDMAEKITTQNLKEGDLVFFNTRGGVSHVGVYLGDNYFAHSSVSSGVTISSLTDDYYSKKFIGGGRINK